MNENFNNLEKSLLFNLSLSSKELFHSNMIYWICNNYKHEFGKIISNTLFKNQDSSILEVYREKNKSDLSIIFSSGQKIIIENKVKSIPNAKQLVEYKEKFNNSNTRFILLSLIPPDFNSKDFGWECISYEELIQILQDFLHKYQSINKFHQLALNDYINFITNLSDLTKFLKIDIESESFNFKGEIFAKFHKIRLHDIYIKYKYTQLMNEIGGFLRRNIMSEIIIGKGHKREDKDKIVNINFNLVRGKGVINIEYFKDPEIILGIMIDGERYNHFIYANSNFRDRKLKIANKLREEKQWFIPSIISKEYSYPKNKTFNNFGEMIYRSVKIPNSVTLKNLIEIIYKDTVKMIDISENL